MQGKITKKGKLEIKRGGEWKLQLCRFVFASTWPFCRDNCPLFTEPQKHNIGLESECITIELCHGKYLTFNKFTDEREENAKDL